MLRWRQVIWTCPILERSTYQLNSLPTGQETEPVPEEGINAVHSPAQTSLESDEHVDATDQPETSPETKRALNNWLTLSDGTRWSQ